MEKLVKHQYVLQMFSQYGELRPTNGFRVLASLLQRRRSPEANQILHDVWPSHGLLHYIYIFGCKLHCVQVLRSPILAALLHGTPATGVSQTLRYGKRMELRNFRRGRHLYSGGQPSRCASAHIVVFLLIEMLSGVWSQVSPRKHVLDGGAHWRNLANTIEPSMCVGDAAFFVKLL